MDLPFGETRNPKFFNIVREKKTDKEILPLPLPSSLCRLAR